MEFAKVRKGLGVGVSDLEGKNSKFRRITFVRMVTKNIPMHFQHPPIKTVEGVRKYGKVVPNDQLIAPKNLTKVFFNLESDARKLLFPICIHHFNFMMIASREDT